MTPELHCFTSFNAAYLDRARVFAHTLKRHNPAWRLWALVVERDLDGVARESLSDFDEVVFPKDIGLPSLDSWLFQHDVVEACTAVKGPFLEKLLTDGAKKVVYVDPDIAVFESLRAVEGWLEEHEILLTPHQLAPDSVRHAIVDNEICSLKHGTFNLGFLAIRNGEQGRAFANWWKTRLVDFCYDDIAGGLFTDQRWCDLIPSFFSNHFVIRDPGYNVASWNLSQRVLQITPTGELLVNGSPLKFFHFTKLGPVGDVMTARYAKDNLAVYELWAWYKAMVQRMRTRAPARAPWDYGFFANGAAIPRQARVIYRQREDLRTAFPQPFASGPGSFHEWLLSNGHLAPQ